MLILNGFVEPFSLEEYNYPLKTRLILRFPHDPSSTPHKGRLSQATNLIFSKLFITELVGFLTLIILPATAEAKLFTFVTELFASKSEVIDLMPNSQNMALLQAVLNPNPTPSGGGEVYVVEGSLLMSETSYASTGAESKPQSDQISLYIVREGDSLSQIAEMFGVSVNTIRWGNDLQKSVISEGQTLLILPVSGVRHVVKSGDTLKGVTERYKGDFEEVLRFNNLSEGTKLAVGDVVVVPGGEVIVIPSSVRASAGTQSSSAKGTPSYEGYYRRPLNGGVRTQGIHGYNAVDLAAPVGTPVYAAAGGEIMVSKNSGWNGGYGNYVVVGHKNGTQTLYAHNSNNIVSVGDSVAQGDVIGYVGSTGRSTGPHIHFEIRGARNPF